MDLLGFVGTYAAGKDLASEYLVSLGWGHVSTGDMVRQIAEEQGLGQDRDTLQQLAKQLRARYGLGYLVELACQKPRPLVVSGIRNVGEAAYIIGSGGALVAFDAPELLRFRRIKARARPDDPKTLSEFASMQAVETSSETVAQNIPVVMQMAKYRIWNPFSGKQHLHQELDRLIAKLPGGP